MATARIRSFDHPDERTTFEHGESIEVHLGELAVARQVMRPGWRWSRDIKPIVGTPSCRFHHTGTVLAGRVHVRLDDGTEAEIGPHSVYDIPPGHDAWVVGDEPAVLVEWAGVHRWAEPPAGERILATVLFTDIVDSTAVAQRMGDAAWTILLDEHAAVSRRLLDRYRGEEVVSTGDGFLAIFDGAARAVQCAIAIRDALTELGLSIRAGLHTGEVEVVPNNVRGSEVHVASRIMSLAAPGEILVSGMTRDLVSARELAFEARGRHRLKGVRGGHRVYAVDTPSPGDAEA